MLLESSYQAAVVKKTGLSVLMAVIGVMFTLFLFAYMMRMQYQDWRTPPLPWQLWLSTAMLTLSSAALALAQRPAWRRAGLLTAAALAVAFVAAQLWVWQQLLAQQYLASANPGNGFFYLLTGMHALHVLGGLLALGWVVTQKENAVALQLCARYWHLLLALWLVLFGAMAGLTPELARVICGGG